MFRVRLLAVQCGRETVRSSVLRKGGRGSLVRTFKDSSQSIAVPTNPSFDVTTAPSKQALGLHPPAVKGADYDYGTRHLQQERPEERDRNQTRPLIHNQRTPEGELISKLTKMRTSKGPGHARLAISVLEQARAQGVTALMAYNTVLRMLAMERWTAKDKATMMEDLVCHLKEDGLEPDIYTFNSIIFVYAQARMAAKAERVYEDMLSQGIEPTSMTLSNLIMAQSWVSPATMYRTLAEMDQKGWVPNRGAHLCLIAAMWQRKDSKGVVDIMSRMLEQDYQPTEAAFAISLMAAGRLGYTDFAKDIFARRTAAGLEPKEEIYSSMMVAFSKSDRHEECLEYWRQLVCVNGIGDVRINLETYHCAIKSAVVMCQWDEVGAILDVMKSQGISPIEQTFKTAMAACKLRGGVDGQERLRSVDRVMELMTARVGVASEPVKLRLAIACMHGSAWDRAAVLFDDAMAQGCEMWPFAWECVIRTLLALKRYEGVKNAWMVSRSEGHKPTYRANELAMTAAQHLGDGDWAIEVLSSGDAKKKSSVTAYAIAIRVLAETDRLEEAHDLLQKWRAQGPVHLNHKHMGRLMASCERYGNTEVALHFLAEMQSRSPPHRLELSGLAFAIKALCKHGRASEVVPLFETQLSVKYRPRGECYANVANAAFEAGDQTNTAKYCEEAKKLGVSASERAEAFAEGGIQGFDLDYKYSREEQERVSAPGKSSANASPSIRQSENDNDDEARVKGENIVVAEAAPAL